MVDTTEVDFSPGCSVLGQEVHNELLKSVSERFALLPDRPTSVSVMTRNQGPFYRASCCPHAMRGVLHFDRVAPALASMVALRLRLSGDQPTRLNTVLWRGAVLLT